MRTEASADIQIRCTCRRAASRNDSLMVSVPVRECFCVPLSAALHSSFLLQAFHGQDMQSVMCLVINHCPFAAVSAAKEELLSAAGCRSPHPDPPQQAEHVCPASAREFTAIPAGEAVCCPKRLGVVIDSGRSRSVCRQTILPPSRLAETKMRQRNLLPGGGGGCCDRGILHQIQKNPISCAKDVQCLGCGHLSMSVCICK